MSLPTLKFNIVRPNFPTAAYVQFDDPVKGAFDGTRLFAPRVPYTDQSTYVRTLRTQRGSTSPNDVLFHSQTGTASVALNNRTRIFDPAAEDDVRPGLPVNIVATWAAVDYDLFTGFADKWDLTYPGKSSSADAIAVLTVTDGQDRFVDLDVTEARPAELTGARIGALADQIQWEAARALATGQSEMAALTQTTSGWAAVTEAADSEFGEVYIDAAGTLTFRDRIEVFTDAASLTSSATFGDGAGEMKYYDVTPSYDTDRIRNDIQVTWNESGSVVSARDTRSIARYGHRSYQIQASLTSGTVAQNLARYLLQFYKDPLQRIDQLIIRPQRDPTNLFPKVLGYDLGTRITVKLTPPGGGSRISRDCIIRGIAHEVNAELWETTWTLQDATPFDASPFIKFDGTSAFDGTKSFLF